MLAYALREKEKGLATIKRLEKELEFLHQQIIVIQVQKRQNELWLLDYEKIISETTSAAPRD
jgi:hypothetical protein